MHVRREKYQIAVPQVEFLGYLIDASRLHPTAAKFQAIQQVLRPTNKMELQVLLGLLNFYMVLPLKVLLLSCCIGC